MGLLAVRDTPFEPSYRTVVQHCSKPQVREDSFRFERKGYIYQGKEGGKRSFRSVRPATACGHMRVRPVPACSPQGCLPLHRHVHQCPPSSVKGGKGGRHRAPISKNGRNGKNAKHSA
eukprot:306908-Prorocentrum_minimum.AAC.5